MKQLVTLLMMFIASLAAAHAQDEEIPDRMENLSDLVGDWRGVLAYLDYGTGEEEQIGMAAVYSLTPDGAYLVSRARFTDPGFDVFILTITTFDPATGDLVESFHRDRSIEIADFLVKRFEKTADGWVMVVEAEGEDDERHAMIKRTVTLDGAKLTMRKDVDFLGDEKEEFIFRNEVRLVRSDEAVSFDDFRQE